MLIDNRTTGRMGYDIAKTAGHRNLRERCDAVLKQGGRNGIRIKRQTTTKRPAGKLYLPAGDQLSQGGP